MSPDDGIQEFGGRNIGLRLVFLIFRGMELRSIGPDRLQLAFEDRRDIVYEGGVKIAILDIMKDIFGPPLFLDSPVGIPGEDLPQSAQETGVCDQVSRPSMIRVAIGQCIGQYDLRDDISGSRGSAAIGAPGHSGKSHPPCPGSP